MRAKVKVVKNKVAPPFQITEFDIMYGQGISREGDLIDVGEKYEVLRRSGSWYNYEGQKIGQGREGTKKFLRENSKVAKQIEKQILKAWREEE